MRLVGTDGTLVIDRDMLGQTCTASTSWACYAPYGTDLLNAVPGGTWTIDTYAPAGELPRLIVGGELGNWYSQSRTNYFTTFAGW